MTEFPVTRKEYDELFLAITRLTDRIEAMEAPHQPRKGRPESFSDLTVRTRNVICTLAKERGQAPDRDFVMTISPREWLRQPNFGYKSLREVLEWLMPDAPDRS